MVRKFLAARKTLSTVVQLGHPGYKSDPNYSQTYRNHWTYILKQIVNNLGTIFSNNAI